jgi:aminoglycoside phosphotransferase (APT) family kinase protein
MTEQAATWFEHSAHRLDIMAHLKESQYAGQSLFTHWCWLSGDTNPTNWRVYDEEEWVLTDWERFCTGHPAIDLGITMPGLGSMDMSLERNIAAQYVRRCSDLGDDLALSEIKLAHQIRLAKLWSAVEFLANAAQLSIEYSKTTIEHLIEFLPELLLRTVSSDHV